MENHNFEWVNQRTKWTFSIANCKRLPEGNPITNYSSIIVGFWARINHPLVFQSILSTAHGAAEARGSARSHVQVEVPCNQGVYGFTYMYAHTHAHTHIYNQYTIKCCNIRSL